MPVISGERVAVMTARATNSTGRGLIAAAPRSGREPPSRIFKSASEEMMVLIGVK